jgi:hypothetical protein
MVNAQDLIVGRSYIYIDRWKNGIPETNMGKLLVKGEFKSTGRGSISASEPNGILEFENGKQRYDWDDKFREVETKSGGKRKTRRNRKSKKLRKSKSRKNRKKSNRRR